MGLSKRDLTKGIKERVRDGGGIVFSTEGRGLKTTSFVAARMTPAEKKAQDEATSVARQQPHRRGSSDPMDESPLGRYCKRRWPVRRGETIEDLNYDHRMDMFMAGSRYSNCVHLHRVLVGLGSGASTTAEGFSVIKTAAEIQADIDQARIARENADAALLRVDRRAVSAASRVCVDELEPMDRDFDLLAACLHALAINFGIVKPYANFGG